LISALAVTLVLSAAAAGSACVGVEVVATGVGAHGASVMPQAAPHRLIRALDRLPLWVARSPGVLRGRIVDLDAAPAINVIPSRAKGRIEIIVDQETIEAGATIEQLRLALGAEVEVAESTEACADAPPADPPTRR
jgi:hypothetical protein